MKSKHTKVNWEFDSKTKQWNVPMPSDFHCSPIAESEVFKDSKEWHEAQDNIRLIEECSLVTNETGLTPRELQKSHAELLEFLALLVNDCDSYHTKEPLSHSEFKEKEYNTSQILHYCRQAIKNAKP